MTDSPKQYDRREAMLRDAASGITWEGPQQLMAVAQAVLELRQEILDLKQSVFRLSDRLASLEQSAYGAEASIESSLDSVDVAKLPEAEGGDATCQGQPNRL